MRAAGSVKLDGRCCQGDSNGPSVAPECAKTGEHNTNKNLTDFYFLRSETEDGGGGLPKPSTKKKKVRKTKTAVFSILTEIATFSDVVLSFRLFWKCGSAFSFSCAPLAKPTIPFRLTCYLPCLVFCFSFFFIYSYY